RPSRSRMKATSRMIVFVETSSSAASFVQLVKAPRRNSSWAAIIRSSGGRESRAGTRESAGMGHHLSHASWIMQRNNPFHPKKQNMPSYAPATRLPFADWFTAAEPEGNSTRHLGSALTALGCRTYQDGDEFVHQDETLEARVAFDQGRTHTVIKLAVV